MFIFSQFVDDIKQVKPYHNPQKYDLIRAGMIRYHKEDIGHLHFPIDVAIAENRSDGNPNIIFRPEFDKWNIHIYYPHMKHLVSLANIIRVNLCVTLILYIFDLSVYIERPC